MTENIDLSNESDFDLVELMTLSTDDGHDSASIAHAALAELFERHKSYLFRRVEATYGRSCGRGFGADDVVNETFFTAFTKSGTFKKETPANADRQRQCVMAWLGGIAKNVFLQMRCNKSEQELRLDPDLVLVALDRKSPEVEDDRCQQIRKAFDSLSEQEQDALRIWCTYYDPDNPRGQLPGTEIDMLCTTLDTTRPGLRKLRSRALQKIREAVEPVIAHEGGG